MDELRKSTWVDFKSTAISYWPGSFLFHLLCWSLHAVSHKNLLCLSSGIISCNSTKSEPLKLLNRKFVICIKFALEYILLKHWSFKNLVTWYMWNRILNQINYICPTELLILTSINQNNVLRNWLIILGDYIRSVKPAQNVLRNVSLFPIILLAASTQEL